jgi:hypothetical protein
VNYIRKVPFTGNVFIIKLDAVLSEAVNISEARA